MKENKNTCSIGISLPDEPIKCKKVNSGNHLKTIKFYPDTKDCYDELDNYLGKGDFKDGVLTIER